MGAVHRSVDASFLHSTILGCSGGGQNMSDVLAGIMMFVADCYYAIVTAANSDSDKSSEPKDEAEHPVQGTPQ
jgi:hypothetical protein